MRITLFSIDETNRLLPEIRPMLEKLRAQKREFDRLETRVGVLAMAAHGASEDNPDTRELGSWLEKRRRLGETIANGVAELQDFGLLVKDLEAGLVDFYTLQGDRLVFLCWRLGESEVGHWHSLEGGFAGRRPLKEAGLD